MKHGRIDLNQMKIADSLRDMGCSVQSLAGVGSGCPDLLVGFQGHNYLFEIKNPERSGKQGKPRKNQQKFIFGWRGQVAVIKTFDDAFSIIARDNFP